MAQLAVIVVIAIFVGPVFTKNEFTHENYNSQCEASSSLGGSITPTYCAFYKDGSLNTDIITIYATYLVKEGTKAAIVNLPSFGCSRLSYKERRKNLQYWLKASKSSGLTIISYTPGCSLPDAIKEAKYAQRHGVGAIMIGTDHNLRHNTTHRQVEFTKEIAIKVYPTAVIVDFETKLRRCGSVNVAKFHLKATEDIPNYWGLRASSVDCMSVIAETNLTKCQGLMTYDSLIFAPIDTSYLSPMASYASSIYSKDVVDIFTSNVEHKSVERPVSLLLKLVKKFGVALSYLSKHFDTYDCETFSYIEPVMREVFICVTNIDIGHSRHSSVYKTFWNLREDLRSSLESSGQYCDKKEDDANEKGNKKYEKYNENDKYDELNQ